MPLYTLDRSTARVPAAAAGHHRGVKGVVIACKLCATRVSALASAGRPADAGRAAAELFCSSTFDRVDQLPHPLDRWSSDHRRIHLHGQVSPPTRQIAAHANAHTHTPSQAMAWSTQRHARKSALARGSPNPTRAKGDPRALRHTRSHGWTRLLPGPRMRLQARPALV